tara:strand:+ start:150 stop:998 length:849 start_codon:yes stop_codon:yes gene_type:complete
VITCRFAGGLGNNLYQLAFLINHSKKHKTPYYIEDCVERTNIPLQSTQSRILEIDNLFENNFIKKTELQYDFSLIKNYRHADLHINSNHLYSEVPHLTNTRYCGYFLSDKYFNDIDINKVFCLNKKIKTNLLKKHKQIMKKPTIALHYRLAGDRQEEEIKKYYNIVSPAFYKESIQKILKMENKSFEDYNILLFSDNISLASQMLTSLNIPFIPIQNNNNVEDFIHMSNCDHNIIGNSTYSWWSAYLNKQNKRVFYPRQEWFSHKLSHVEKRDMFPAHWIGL